jgi:hypothetical protein
MSKYKKRKRKKYQMAGMYEPNVIQAGLSPNITENIVFNESDPQTIAAQEQAFESEKENLQEEAKLASQELKSEADKRDLQSEERISDWNKKEAIVTQGVKSAVKQFGTSTGLSLAKGAPGQLSAQAGRQFARSLKVGAKKGFNSGRAQRLLARSGRTQRAFQTGKNVGKTASKINPWGLVSLAGQGISALSDDKNAKQWNAGEVIGDVASAAGTGAQLGSMILPGIGTAVGAVGGAVYAGAKGLIQRNKARKDWKTNKRLKEEAQLKSNREMGDQFLSQYARARQGEIYGKTYSGYDLGRNTVAKYGGLKKYI